METNLCARDKRAPRQFAWLAKRDGRAPAADDKWRAIISLAAEASRRLVAFPMATSAARVFLVVVVVVFFLRPIRDRAQSERRFVVVVVVVVDDVVWTGCK